MTLSQHFPFRLSYSSHLALHSFPTRRSSDLGIVLPAPLNSRVRSAPSPLRVGPPPPLAPAAGERGGGGPTRSGEGADLTLLLRGAGRTIPRSEERRVGKECRARWELYDRRKGKCCDRVI